MFLRHNVFDREKLYSRIGLDVKLDPMPADDSASFLRIELNVLSSHSR